MRSKRASPTISGGGRAVDQDISFLAHSPSCAGGSMTTPHADAIIVLGCALHGDAASPALVRRAGLVVVATAQPPGRGLIRELPLRLRELVALALSLTRLRRSRG